MDKESTILLKKGVDRGSLIYMEGENDLVIKDTLQVLSNYVPVNTKTLEVALGTSLKKGDRIMVTRPSGKEWIASLGCNIIWRRNQRLRMERRGYGFNMGPGC